MSPFRSWWADRTSPPRHDRSSEVYPDPNAFCSDLFDWDIAKHGCPDCGCKNFLEGASGGMSTNVLCTGCLAEFNVMAAFNSIQRIRR